MNQSSLEQRRIADIFALLPPGLNSLLEIGSRNPYMTQLFAEHVEQMIALDLEKPAIEHPKITCMAGNLVKLPLPDKSVDVIVCTEVLEHIPPHQLAQACHELQRVSRNYLLIGVPYRQDLRLGRTRCQHCGRTNPPWGHVNVFNEHRLHRLLHPWACVRSTKVGKQYARTNRLSTWLMEQAGNPWGTYQQQESCIYCGKPINAPKEPLPYSARAYAKLAWSLNQLQRMLGKPRPIWLHTLWQRPMGEKTT